MFLLPVGVKIIHTTESHFEADPEAGLHDFTHRLIGEL